MTAQGVEIEITVVVVVGRQAQDRPPLVDEPRPPGDLQKATPSLIAKQQVGEAKVAHVEIGITVRVVVEGQRAKAVPARAQHAVEIAELDEALLVRPALVLVCAGAAMRREQVHPAIAVVIGKSGARRGPGIGELDVDEGQAPIHVFEELIGTEEVDGVQIKIAIGVVVDEDPAHGRAGLHAIQIGGDKGPIPLVAVEQRSRTASQPRDKQIRQPVAAEVTERGAVGLPIIRDTGVQRLVGKPHLRRQRSGQRLAQNERTDRSVHGRSSTSK